MRLLSPTITWEDDGVPNRAASFLKDHMATSNISCIDLGKFMLVWTDDNTLALGANDVRLTEGNIIRIRQKMGLPELPEGERRTEWRRWVREIVDHQHPKLRNKMLHLGPGQVSKDGR